jgi:NAD(P)H-dependent flavin oxidoreductase YrpB (nitropropane dioxygenase family)
MNPRRLSQAISEGDGISVIVEVDSPEAARDAQDGGAEALFVRSGLESRIPSIRAATELPILCTYDGQQASALEGADACLVDLGEGRDTAIEHLGLILGDQFELAPRISKDEDLEFVLEELDPEILVLSGAAADQTALEHVLELLPDVPAGKLAIADVGARTRDEVEELERAGVDGVIVGAGNIAHLVGAAPPEV